MITLLTHFRNESFLLKPFLEHHKGLFDHGIMIDNGSDDDSVGVIREICSEWEIVQSHAQYDQPEAYIDEVQEHESRCSGWKIALNVTEFLLHNDLRSYLTEFENKHPDQIGIRCNGVNMVDSPEESNSYDGRQPLLKQKHFGYFESDLTSKRGRDLPAYMYQKQQFLLHGVDGRGRFLHRAEHGQYGQGRHHTKLQNVWPRPLGPCPDSDLICCWFGYAPMKCVRHRKNRHFNTPERAEQIWRVECGMSYDLLRNDLYRRRYDQLFEKEDLALHASKIDVK